MKKILFVGYQANYKKTIYLYNKIKNYFNVILLDIKNTSEEKKNELHNLNIKKVDIELEFNYDNNSLTNLYNEKKIDNNNFTEKLLNYFDEKKLYNTLLIDFEKIEPDLIIIFNNDILSLFASLAANKMGINIATIESGLRNANLNNYLQINRIIIDYLSKYRFVISQREVDNLKNENITENIYVVNTPIQDTLVNYLQDSSKIKFYKQLKFEKKKYILVLIKDICCNKDEFKIFLDDLIQLSKSEKIVFSINDKIKANIKEISYLELLKSNIVLCESIEYLQYINLLNNCKYIITDIEEIQEEANILNVSCFSLLPESERKSTLVENGGTTLLVDNIKNIKVKNIKVKNNKKKNTYISCSELIKDIFLNNIFNNNFYDGWDKKTKGWNQLDKEYEVKDISFKSNAPTIEADAIFVLAGGIDKNGLCHRFVQDRLDFANELYKKNNINIYCLGGGSYHTKSILNKSGFIIHETTSCAEYLIKKGVNTTHIYKEWASYDTIANGFFAFTNFILPLKQKKIVLVTSNFHMPRAKYIFNWINKLFKKNIEIICFSTTNSSVESEILNIRIKREKNSLLNLIKLSKEYNTLEKFHNWFFTIHKAYSSNSELVRENKIDNICKKTY